MIHKIYSVYDSAAMMHNQPFFVTHEKVAIRSFKDACNNPESTHGQHPEDYTLFSLGTYDDESGTITQDKIISLGNGLQFQEKDQ